MKSKYKVGTSKVVVSVHRSSQVGAHELRLKTHAAVDQSLRQAQVMSGTRIGAQVWAVRSANAGDRTEEGDTRDIM